MVETPDKITLPGLAGNGRVSRRIQDHLGLLTRRQLMKVAQELKEAHVAREVDLAEAPKHPQVRFDPSLKSQGTHRPAQDGKKRTIKRSFAYSATRHRYTNIEKSLDRSLQYAYCIGMYLRTTKRHNKDGSTVEYYQLAETRWDPTQRRPTAHIIHNFGRANTLDREALLRLAQSISRVCQGGLDIPPEVSPPGEAIDIEWARPLGVVHVARALWEELGIGAVLRGLEPRGPRRAPHALALFTMAANPLAEPLST